MKVWCGVATSLVQHRMKGDWPDWRVLGIKPAHTPASGSQVMVTGCFINEHWRIPGWYTAYLPRTAPWVRAQDLEQSFSGHWRKVPQPRVMTGLSVIASSVALAHDICTMRNYGHDQRPWSPGLCRPNKGSPEDETRVPRDKSWEQVRPVAPALGKAIRRHRDCALKLLGPSRCCQALGVFVPTSFCLISLTTNDFIFKICWH